MSKSHNKRCPYCGYLEVIKWGKRNGHYRYFCKNCNSYYTDSRSAVSDRNMFVWFEQWVGGKQSIQAVSNRSGYSERTLKRYFYQMLPKCPTWHIQRRERVNLLIDGTYFANKVCLVLYRDANIKMTILYRLTKGEVLRELKEDLLNIKSVGIEIESVTCDGGANILRAVKEVCPEAVQQRCTAHIAREIRLWLTKKPQAEAAIKLLELIKYLGKIETRPDAQLWTKAFIDWYCFYEDFINEKSYDEITGRWWYKHKMLHRSCSHIKRAIPTMFNYTMNAKIPKTSNSIESFFGHLKDNLRLHRGLSNEHFRDFVKWYLYFNSNQNKIAKK